MPASDDENESGESEPYTITSESGIEYESTQTFGELLVEATELLGVTGRISKKKLAVVRARFSDLTAILEANTGENQVGVDADDALEVLELPEGWETEIDEDDDEAE